MAGRGRPNGNWPTGREGRRLLQMSDVLPDEATVLFRERPESFVAARDALAAELRAEGRPDEAAAVRALRRPTVVVWALNQLSQADRPGVGDLLSAGAELRAAQQATLSSSGSGAERLRIATGARRAAVSRLVEKAGTLLDAAGRGVRSDEIASALEAASVDGATAERLEAGTLERVPESVSGFGEMFGLTAIPGGSDEGEAGSRSRTKRPRTSTGPSDADLGEAEATVAGLRRDRDAAARRTKTARDKADRLAVRAEGMRERLAAAEADHAEADAHARGAELEAARTERALDTATGELDRLRGEAR